MAGCDRARPGHANVCGACAGDLARALGAIPGLSYQLEITLSRQSSHTAGRRSATRPLPFDPRASWALAELRRELYLWTCRVWKPSIRVSWPGPLDALSDLSRFLFTHDDLLMAHAEADQAVARITGLVHEGERIIDRPADRWFAGPCDQCGQDIYAQPGAVQVACPDCRYVYDVNERRVWLLQVAEDHLAYGTLIAQALTSLGTRVTPELLWQWARRGRIVAHGVDRQGRPLYRIGDVMDELAKQRDKVS